MSFRNPPCLKNRKVFVTGATGLIGSHLTRFLVEGGAEVTVLIRDHVPHNYLLDGDPPRFNTVTGDLQDYRLVERALAEYEAEVVFHLGAQTQVQIANRSPVGTFKSNIEGTWNLLEACRQVPTVKAVLVASSDKAYGQAETLPYTEETPLRGDHPYDASKSCADIIARTYWVTYQLPVAIIRSGNVFGVGDLNFSRIIPGTIRSVLLGESPIIRSDGTLVRDYFYVKDAAMAYLATAEALLADTEKIGGEAFNFSNELRMTVLEVTQRILEIMGRDDLEPVILDQAPDEILQQSLSAEKARRVLGWTPQYPFEQGVEETVEFVRGMLD